MLECVRDCKPLPDAADVAVVAAVAGEDRTIAADSDTDWEK